MRGSHAGDRDAGCLLQVINKPILIRLVIIDYANRNHLQNMCFGKLRLNCSDRKMDKCGLGKEIGERKHVFNGSNRRLLLKKV
jgi:hypothetical protein